jgi:hypothetical protein
MDRGIATALLAGMAALISTVNAAAATSAVPSIDVKVQAVAKHYGAQVDPGGGWRKWPVLAVALKPRAGLDSQKYTVLVTVALAEGDARDLLGRDAEARRRAVGFGVCPSRGDPLYEVLSAEDHIEIQAVYHGNVAADVDCRVYAVGVERQRTPLKSSGAQPTKANESIYEKSVLQATTSDRLTNADLAWHALNTYGWDCEEVVRRDEQKGDYFMITCKNGKRLRVYPREGQHPVIRNARGGYE